ncbi:hypothetical protein BGZ57DRAFT_958795 [Hyaloscypha finlandica]|nr:hypothetical protein BGZ57DRAFT_958795 [Hyaloscypha finlandica]
MKETFIQKDVGVKAGRNPKDLKYPDNHGGVPNSGDDIATMHVIASPHGSFAEYGIAPATTMFLIPPKTSFQGMIPLAALTAAIALYQDLELPPPRRPARRQMSLVFYSASSAVGTLAIKFARKSNIHPGHPIIAKPRISFTINLIHPSQGDVVLGDRDGEASVVIGVQQTIQRLGLRGVSYAFDTIAKSTNVKLVAQLVKSGGHLNVIGPRRDCSAVPANVKTSVALVVVVLGQAFPLNDTFKMA